MSSTSVTASNVTIAFKDLPYEPVLDSESTIKTWIGTQNQGTFSAIVNNSYVKTDSKSSYFEAKNPSTGNVLAKVANTDSATLEAAIASCRISQAEWSALSSVERGKIIYNIARNIQKHLTLLVTCESLFSGRTSREIKDLDIANLIKTFYYYAGHVGLHNNDSDFDSLEPLGVVAIAGYYDSPLLSIGTKLAAALATGNTCLLVPHKYTPVSIYMLHNICIQSGVPSGVINLVVSDKDDIYKSIATNPKIDCVCYDGKTQIGQDLMVSQSYVNPNKRSLLSLEGKSSLVIYDTADIDSAIEAIVDGCFYANGQHRHSLNKVLIQEPVLNEVLVKLNSRFEKIRYGTHMDKCNDYGPFIDKTELKAFKEAISSQAIEFGANVKQFDSKEEQKKKGDETLPPTSGPIVINNIGLNLPLNLNEINGPYVIVIPFRTVKESIELLNTSKYGSSVSLFSQNISLVLEAAYLINAGTIWINSFSVERGVQTRKLSGNYMIQGLESLRNFLRPKWERQTELKVSQPDTNLENVMKKLKAFGSTNAEPTLPSSQNLQVEKTYKLYVGGKQARADTQSSRSIYCKGSGNKSELYCLVADASRKDVRNAVQAAVAAFNPWKKRANHNKSQILYYFGENFEAKSLLFVEKLEKLTNKPRVECEAEVKLCIKMIHHFASICDKRIGKMNDTTEYGFSLELDEPLGCIAIVCGHNENSPNPLLQFVVHMMAAIAYGNTVIMVPDETVPVPALDLYEIFDTSDMPGGVVNILTGSKHHLTKYLCEHQEVNAIWYVNDVLSKANVDDERIAQQFVKYTCNFSLKRSWLISSAMLMEEPFLCKNYSNELASHATQAKHIQIAMGTIFAN